MQLEGNRVQMTQEALILTETLYPLAESVWLVKTMCVPTG